VLRFAPVLLFAALLRLAVFLLVPVRRAFTPARARLVLALPRVERVFDAVADFFRRAAFGRPPAFAAGRPRFAAPRFAPALALFRARVPLALLRVPPALRPFVLERRRRAARALERPPDDCSPEPDCPISSSIMDSSVLDWSSGMVISCRSPQFDENTGSVTGVPSRRSEIIRK
jgi:hypothetical protein